MIIANYVSNRPNMGETATYEDFYKFLGTRPNRLGVMARLYPELTASFLTESLFNVFYKSGTPKKFESTNAMMFEWEIETNFIDRPEFADVPTQFGENGTEITMAFKKRYYEKYDIFQIEKTRQQCLVIARPVRKADNYWEVLVRLIDNDYSSVLDIDGCNIGDTTRFLSNAHPEMHEEGYIKYQSNIEKHRGYITTHRVDVSYSALFAAHEDVFVSIAEGKDQGCLTETMYKMNKKEKDLFENFMAVRNNGLLFNKTNVDINGKSTILDPDTGRPIYIGDGIVPQVERFASKYSYSKLTPSVMTTALQMMNEKAAKAEGNEYILICNEKLWNDVQISLAGWLSNFHISNTYLWSKAANGYVDVGETYQSWQFAGNKLTFKVDRTFSREFGTDKGYGIILDLTADKVENKPAISMFTLKGADFVQNKFLGVGGEDGVSSGVVSSAVAASKLINWGYSGVGVFAPYRSFILMEN